MGDILYPALRITVMYLTLLILARIIGRKMISQMTFLDFTVSITIGSVAATTAIGPYSASLVSGIIVLLVLTALVLIIEFLHIKCVSFRKLVESEPLVVIEKGQIVYKNLKKERFTFQELNALLREKNIFNIADVEFALLEHDGKLSVLPKSDKQPLKPSDMNIYPPYQGLTRDLIIDGVIMDENLKYARITTEMLMQKLDAYGVKSSKDVFYAGLDSSDRLYLSLKNDNKENHSKYGIE